MDSSSYLNDSAAPLSDRNQNYNHQPRGEQYELRGFSGENAGFYVDELHPHEPHLIDPQQNGIGGRRNVSHSPDAVERFEYDDGDVEDGRNWAVQNPRETTEIINALPSRQLEEIVATVGQINNFKERTRKSRRTAKYATMRRMPQEADDEEIMDALANEMDEADGDLHLNSMLRENTSATLSHKRQLRRKMTSKKKVRHVTWWKRQKYKVSLFVDDLVDSCDS